MDTTYDLLIERFSPDLVISVSPEYQCQGLTCVELLDPTGQRWIYYTEHGACDPLPPLAV